jgi:hypothetical protein
LNAPLKYKLAVGYFVLEKVHVTSFKDFRKLVMTATFFHSVLERSKLAKKVASLDA